MKPFSIYKKEILNFSSFLLPKHKKEYFIFSLFFMIYISYSFILVFKTSLIDYADYPYDLYFNFDNPTYYKQGYTEIFNHPLIRFIYFVVIVVGNTAKTIFCYKIKTILFVVFLIILSSLSCVYIFRYLRIIINLNITQSLILTIFFGFISTNMILCFTPESFPLSSFLIISMVLYYSTKIKENTRTPYIIDCFYAIGLGGITITNVMKGVIASLFVNGVNKKQFIRIISFLLIFILILFSVPNFFSFILDAYKEYGGHQINQKSLQQHDISFYISQLFDFFFGATLLFPNFLINDRYTSDRIVNMIILDVYQYIWQYMWVLIVYVCTILSIIKGIKNKFVLFILSLISVDIFIHVICLYGYSDYFIFGGHWIYSVPLLIGWLYKYIPQEWRKYYTCLLCLLTVVLVINNIIRFVEFIELGMEYYSI